MYISHVFGIILISCGAAATYLGISALRKQFREYSGNIILGLLCFFSAIWSYGFGSLYLTYDPGAAYWGRTIGMIGVFGFLITAQFLVGVLVKIPAMLYRTFCAFAFLGIILYFPTVSPSVTSYFINDMGMAYTFKAGLVNNIYSAYSVIYAINMLVSVYFMLKYAKNRRSKVTGHKMAITILIIVLGMVLDTIMPLFGYAAIPGSSISQFLGLLVIFYAIVDFNKTRITPLNMSVYVYGFVSEPIMVFDPNGMLKLATKSAKEVFSEAFKIYDDEVSIWDVFYLDEDYFEFDEELRSDDSSSIVGNIPVMIETNKIRDRFGDIIGYITLIKDMTRIKEMMDSLKEAKQQAEINSLAKSAFLANMSHEIRTPLNAIVGFSELLLKGDMPDKDKEQVEDIRNSSYNLLAIINDVLDISKIESGKMELVEGEYSVTEVIRDAYLITDTIASKKGLKFEASIADNIPSMLYGDAVRVRGILVNILNNAVKYTAEGSVKLEASVTDIMADVANLQFKISDTGIGIKDEDKEKLFDSFLQVDKKKNSGIEGTGLGLAIVKGFVELMGGSIRIESEYGNGSCFIVDIPQRIVNEKPIGKFEPFGNDKKEVKSSIGDVKYHGIRVLAVDDNKVNLKLISRCLEKYEMDVTLADSGLKAIKLCKDNEYDIILMDQMMPVMDGIEAMCEIRNLGGFYTEGGNCVIIALTANAISGVKEELIEKGFDDYLSKPIEFAKMEEMFTGLLSKGRIKVRQ